MRIASIVTTLAAALLGGCAGDNVSGPDAATTPATPTATTPTATGTTEAPAPECDADEVLAVVDSAIEAARLAAGGQWSSTFEGNPFAERTATGEKFAERLALDCGLTAQQSPGVDHRLVVAAWTGERVAYVAQASDGPSTPYSQDATLDLRLDVAEGEFLDGDERAVWAGTVATGETIVVGHVDYSLGAAAKAWPAQPGAPGEESTTLDSERHGIAVLDEAGMRNVGIAQPPEMGSEEGYVQFVSPAGQILVADIAPVSWFDPTMPRFFTGPSRVESIAGVDVRVTEPTPEDNLGFTRSAEFGWSCEEFVWILEPPFNGDADETVATVEAVLETQACGRG